MLEKLPLIFLLFSFLNVSYAIFHRNNACKTFADYWIRDISPDCFYNPDVGKNTVCIIMKLKLVF